MKYIIEVELDEYYSALMERFVNDCGSISAADITRAILKDILDDEYAEITNDDQAA